MKMPILALALSMMSAPALAATFVYVSNAEDGTIGMYTLQADGKLEPGARTEAAKVVMPMAVSPDKRFLIAAVRSKPYEAYTYSIDKKSGALKLVGKGPLAESYPYIAIDPSGRYLLSASYGGHQVGVNPIGKDGKVGAPQQVIPTARNAHAIITDTTGKYVFVPHLGTDQIFQFVLDKKSGKLTSNTPATVQMKQGTGPAPHHRVEGQQVRLPAERADRDRDGARARRQDRHAEGAAIPPPRCRRIPSSAPASRAPRWRPDRPRAMWRTTSGPPTCTSRRTASSSMRRSARRARSAASRWMPRAAS